MPVLVLREKTSSSYVADNIAPNDVLRFYKGARAVIEHAGGTLAKNAQIERLPALENDNEAAGRIVVKLATGRNLETSAIGQPVSVFFDTSQGSALVGAANRLQASIGWAGRKVIVAVSRQEEPKTEEIKIHTKRLAEIDGR